MHLETPNTMTFVRRVREEELGERRKELEDAKNAWANQQAKAVVNVSAWIVPLLDT